VQTIIASFARSFREAQTYLQFLMIIPAIPSILLVVNPIKAVTWMLATPLLSQSLLINQLARGDDLALLDIALSVSGTLAAALLAALVAVRLYRGERLALAV
jgi:sodium transport system permease protein